MQRISSWYFLARGVAWATLALLSTTAVMAAGGGAGQGYPTEYLTGPAEGDALEIALGYIHDHQVDLGLAPSDLSDIVVKDRFTSRHNGLTHLYLRQQLNGIEVVNGDINVNVNRDGRLLNLGNQFVSNLAGVANVSEAVLAPSDAVLAAVDYLGLDVPNSLVEIDSLIAGETLFAGGRLSRDDIPVSLRYLADGQGGARLVFSARFRMFDSADWWTLWVDAVNGDVLDRANWTDEAGCTECYAVYAVPKESPLDGDRTIEIAPADPVASPFGWHDTDGAAGAEFTDTRGNNTESQTDLDANNNPSGETRGQGGADLQFNPPLDLTQSPGNYLEGAVVNLFYWNNVMHDVLYQYGFDEESGNFQVNNYGKGGIGGDPVQADAQDGSGTNNANFSTPADGADPRMQMFVWLSPFQNTVEVLTPANIAGSYGGSTAAFGPDFPQAGVEGDLVLAEDGVGGDENDACEALTNGAQISGNVALINRGTCSFVTKIRNAQDVGAAAVVIVNNVPGNPITMGDDGTGGDIAIPSTMLSMDDGDIIKGEIASGVTANVRPAAEGEVDPNRDSDLDNGVIAHEYGHGLSNRLTGGPGNVFCLNNSEQMGEGWSDLMALFLSTVESDTGDMARGIGNYLIFEGEDGTGIRNFPYSTDLNVNPQVYSDIGFTNVPHGVGEIWASIIWDVYWAMIDEYGFDADLYNGTGGNNVTFQLLLDGMKLQGCSPSFVDGRDGILLADLENNGGANECLLWEAFAKRGLGVAADDNGSGVGGETDSFDVPAQCDGNVGVEASLSGTCPGSVTIDITGATPNGPVRLYYSESTGETVVQQAQCSGLILDLDDARLATSLAADGMGNISATFSAGVNQCGLVLQAADEGSCEPSNTISVP